MAAPVWQDFMSRYLANATPREFPRALNIEERTVCATSGAEADASCTDQFVEFFAVDQPPLPAGTTASQTLPIDLWTGQVANDLCRESVAQVSFSNLIMSGSPIVEIRDREAAQSWLNSAEGQQWAAQSGTSISTNVAPTTACSGQTERPISTILQPFNDAVVKDKIQINGIASAPNFAGYKLEYGLVDGDQVDWRLIESFNPITVPNGNLAEWDTKEVTNGNVKLRLTVFGPINPYSEFNERASVVSEIQVTIENDGE